MTSTVIGKFDYEGDTARIEGDSVPSRKMIAKVVSYVAMRGNKTSTSLKGKNVVAQIIEEGEFSGWIEHVQELPLDQKKPATEPTKEELDRSREKYNATAAKMAKAGFGQPTPGPAPDPAHKEAQPAGPAKDPGLKIVEGQIIAIDKPAHKITLKDRAGEHHTFVWGPANDADFQKLEQWWFCKVTGEHQEDFDIWKAMGTGFFKRPDDWPARGGASGGHQYQPRNERLIVLQSCAKLAAEVYAITTTPDTQDFDQAMDTIIARAIKDTETLMKNGGA